MTRKDYIEMGRILRLAQQQQGETPSPQVALDWLIGEIAQFFQRDNPRFDKVRFLAACLGEDE